MMVENDDDGDGGVDDVNSNKNDMDAGHIIYTVFIMNNIKLNKI